MKKTVKLTNIQITKTTSLDITLAIVFILGTVIAGYHFFLQERISQFYPVPIIPNKLFIWAVILSILFICLGMLLDYLNQTEIKISLKELILIHNWYTLNPRDKEKKEVENSAYFKFRNKGGNLEIWFYADGFPVAQKKGGLKDILSSKLKMHVIDNDTTNPECDYYKLSEKPESERLNATNEFL